MYVCMYVCVNIYVCVDVCLYVCVRINVSEDNCHGHFTFSEQVILQPSFRRACLGRRP